MTSHGIDISIFFSPLAYCTLMRKGLIVIPKHTHLVRFQTTLNFLNKTTNKQENGSHSSIVRNHHSNNYKTFLHSDIPAFAHLPIFHSLYH